jgi:hypothetical protein
VAIALAKAHQSNMPQAERLLAINLTGLFTNLIIGWGAWTVVRHRTFRTCDPTVFGHLSKAMFRSCIPGEHVCPRATAAVALNKPKMPKIAGPHPPSTADFLLCRLYPLVDVLMPISFLQPALTLALVTTQGWEKWNASYWDSLLVSAPLLIFSRAAVCFQVSHRL